MMVNRSVLFAYLAVIPLAFVVAFLLQLSVDQVIAAADRPAILTVRGDPDVRSTEVYDAVARYASDSGVRVARLVDEAGTSGGRRLFMTDGPWLTDGYPAFHPSTPTAVSPFGDLGLRHSAGTYLVYGSEPDAAVLATLLQRFGLNTVVDPALTAPGMLLMNRTHLWACVGALIVLILLVISGEFSSTKKYGVQRLCGTSLAAALSKELAAITRRVLVLCLGGGAAAGLGLWAFNGLAQVGDLARTIALLAGVGFLGVFAAQLCAGTLVFSLVHLVEALKGKMRGVPVMPVYYAVRVPLIALIVMTAAQASVTLHGIRLADAERANWSEAARFQCARLSSALLGGDDDWASLDRTVGPWLAERLGDGRAMLAGSEKIIDPAGNLISEVLYVDEGYLARNPVLLSTGARLSSQPDQVIVGVPERLSASTDGLLRRVDSFLKLNGNPDVQAQLQSVSLAPYQRLFTYGAGMVMSDGNDYRSGFLQDPLVVVLPADALSPALLVSSLSRCGLLFTDQARLAADLDAAPQVARYFQSIDSAAAGYNTQYAGSLKRLVEASFLVLLLLLSVGATAVGLASSYRNIHRQKAHVRFLLGWSFSRIFARVLVVEVVAWLALLVMFVRYARGVGEQAATGSILGGQDSNYMAVLAANLPFVAAATFAVAIALLALCLFAVSRKIRHD